MSNIYTFLKYHWISVGCKLMWQIEFCCQKSGIDLKRKRTGPEATALGSITAAKWIVNKIKSESRRQTQFNTLSNCQLYIVYSTHTHPHGYGCTFIICANICQKWQLAVGRNPSLLARVLRPAGVAGSTLLGILAPVLSRLSPAPLSPAL